MDNQQGGIGPCLEVVAVRRVAGSRGISKLLQTDVPQSRLAVRSSFDAVCRNAQTSFERKAETTPGKGKAIPDRTLQNCTCTVHARGPTVHCACPRRRGSYMRFRRVENHWTCPTQNRSVKNAELTSTVYE